MGLPRCGLGYVDDNVGRSACEIVSTRKISSRADQRTCIPRRGTYDLNTEKGEVGGSSPPRPTIQTNIPSLPVDSAKGQCRRPHVSNRVSGLWCPGFRVYVRLSSGGQ